MRLFGKSDPAWPRPLASLTGGVDPRRRVEQGRLPDRRLSPCAPGEALRGRTHAIEVLGIGHQRSRGIKSGVVTNLEAAEQAIRCAVDAAERLAGVTVESLIVSVTCGRLASESFAASVSLPALEPIVLDNGVELMLPVEKPAAALATVARLDAEKRLLSREITAVDMRLPDQMIVRLDEKGLAARKDLLKEREKIARRQRTNT